MPEPGRGEVWVVDLGLAGKIRPALILSVPPEDVDRALATIVPHTTSTRGTRFEVQVSAKFLKAGAFDAQNLITIPLAKAMRQLGTLATNDLARIDSAVRAWLGL